MIIVSGVLVVLAMALLVTGMVVGHTGQELVGLDGLKLIYVSIGISIISALCLAIGVVLRRKELFGGAASSTSRAHATAGRAARAGRPAKTKTRVGAADDAAASLSPSAAPDVPAETTVYVVPGRKRYHLETCRQLAGRAKEELTFEEAREEGFTPCTACLPDNALAARASAPGERPAGTESETDAALPPAEVTRTDLHTPWPELGAGKPTIDEPTAEPAYGDHADDDAEPAYGWAEDAEPAYGRAEDLTTTAAEDTETSATSEFSERDDAWRRTLDESPARGRSFFEPLDRTRPPETAEETTTADTGWAAEPATSHETEETAERAESPGRDDETDGFDETDGSRVTRPTEYEPADEADEADAEPVAAGEDAAADEPAGAATAVEQTGPSDDGTAVLHEDDVPVGEDGLGESTSGTASGDEAPGDEDAGKAATDEDRDAEHTEAETAASGDDAAGHPGPGDDGVSAGDEETTAGAPPVVRILSGTKRFHRPECTLIEDIAEDADDIETVPVTEAKERGCTPCLVCQPDKDPADLD